MINLPDLIDQLDADSKTVTGLIRGNDLFRDGVDVSVDGHREANESRDWYAVRLALLQAHRETGLALIEHGYPRLPKQFASQAVIDEFRAFVKSLTAATDEYLPPVEVPLETTLEAPLV